MGDWLSVLNSGTCWISGILKARNRIRVSKILSVKIKKYILVASLTFWFKVLELRNYCKAILKPEAVAQRCSVRNVFWEISQNSHENTYASVSFLIKLQALACSFIKKETLVQVFSCEFCKISKNTFSYRTPQVAASVKRKRFSKMGRRRLILKRDPTD